MRLSINDVAKELLALLRKAPFDVSTPEGRSKERYRRIAMSAFSALWIRGVSIIAAIITTPLTLNYLGVERFGLWMTISSITALLSFADFGIGSGLLNAISRADGKNDRDTIRRAVSRAFFILTLIATLLIGLFGVFYGWLPWDRVFSLSDPVMALEASHAAAVLVVCIALNLPLATVVRVQMGYQEGFESNLWQFVASLGVLVGVVIAALTEASLAWLTFASNGIPVLVTLLNWIAQFGIRRKWLMPRFAYFDTATGYELFRTGLVFAALQLVAFIGFFSDNFIIAKLMGPTAVAPYAIVLKIFSSIFIVQFIIGPFWPALNEAISRGDLDHARQMFDRLMYICLASGGIIACLLIALGRPGVVFWVGRDLVPEWSLLFGFGLWAIVASYYAAIASLLSGSGFISQQLRILGLAAIASFFLKIIMIRFIGISGAIWASVLGYGVLIFYARAIASRALKNP